MLRYQMGKKRQKQRKSSQRPRPTATNTAMGWGHVHGIGGHRQFKCVMRETTVQEEAITSGKRREENPIRRVQDLMGWYQAWRQRTCTHTRTHARTHAQPRPTKETQSKVRAPPWSVGPVHGSEASTADFCRVTELGFTSRTGTHPSLGAECEQGEMGKKGASPRGPKQLPFWAAEGKGADSIP